MVDRTRIATTCLHISAVIYFLLALVFLGLSFVKTEDFDLPLFLGAGLCAFTLALVVGIELVAAGLRRRKFWAWVAGLCIFGLYVPSLFLPLGGLGLWGLLAPGSRAAFGLKT